jgi:hypothetical protein
MLLLVAGVLELYLGPPVDQGKIDQILACMMNWEKESKEIKSS